MLAVLRIYCGDAALIHEKLRGMGWLAMAAWLIPAAPVVRAVEPSTQPADRPNIVVICADGLSAGMMGFEGHPVVKTPNLDKLAAESVRFSRAYVTMPQATGSRMSILTGQYPHVNGVMKEGDTLSGRSVTFAEVLARKGYACGLVGSWKLLAPEPEKTAGPGGNLPGMPGGSGVPPGSGAAVPPGAMTPAAPPPGFSSPGMGRANTGAPMTPPSPAAVGPGQSTGAGLPGTTIRPTATQPSSGPTPRTWGSTQPTSGPTPRTWGYGHRPSGAATSGASPTSAPAPTGSAAVAPAPPVPMPVLPKLPKPGFGFDAYYATSDPASPFENAKVCLNGDQQTADRYLPDWHTQRAIDFVQRSGSKPFCLCLFYPEPAESLDYPPGMGNLYPPKDLPNPPADTTKLPNRLTSCEPARNYNSRKGDKLRESQSKYYATITRMDENIGRLLRTLKDLNLDRKTVVVFISDQGFATGRHGLWGTGPVFFEEFIRCPLLVRLPGFGQTSAPATGSSGSLVKQMVSFVDVGPTLLEAAGLPVPPIMQGRSLMPLLRDGTDPGRASECFVECDSFKGQQFPARTLVADPYKFIRYLQDPEQEDQLYNLDRDPNEEQNLVSRPGEPAGPYSSVVKVMRARLDRWRKRTHDASTR
jgi:arylsulfatase A-like enzyme